MSAKVELWEYFMDHSDGRTAKKNAVNAFIGCTLCLDDVMAERLLNVLKANRFKFRERASGGNFDWSFRELAFPFKTKSQRTVLHEIGHALDYKSGEMYKETSKNGAIKTRFKEEFYSSHHKLSSGKTLSDTVKSEIKSNCDVIYNDLIRRYREEVLEKLDNFPIDKFFEANELLKQDSINRHKYRVRYLAPSESRDPEKLREYERKQEEKAKHTLNYDVKHELFKLTSLPRKSDEYHRFDKKYGTVLDMLSGCLDTSNIWCGHSRSYMNSRKQFGLEFFADMFSSEFMGKEDEISYVREWMPRSYAAYRELIDFIRSAA